MEDVDPVEVVSVGVPEVSPYTLRGIFQRNFLGSPVRFSSSFWGLNALRRYGGKDVINQKEHLFNPPVTLENCFSKLTNQPGPAVCVNLVIA